MSREIIAILDFGSQYGQLIARRVRELNVYSQICRADITARELSRLGIKGLILSGGPASVYDEKAPKCDEKIFELGVPILGICYGMQLGCQVLGAKIIAAQRREYGRTTLSILEKSDLFANIPDSITAWASHGDQIGELSDDFVQLAATDTCPFAAVRHNKKKFFGVQFHPEVSHTPKGSLILKNFLYDICGCSGDWKMSDFVSETLEAVRSQASDAKVICGLSGGVDSSVVASLVHKAIGDQLVCIFVDNGLLRKNECEDVVSMFRNHFHMDLRVVDWSQQFLAGLAGVTDPQQKRKIIGSEFIKAFESEASKIPNAKFLAQGTLYPDVIESGSKDGNPAANIKLHHNVGGLPAEMGFELIEPLRDLFKDEVRIVGEYLGLPEDIVWRHPFPGPGLAVRVIGEITAERLEILRAADEILIDEIKSARLYRKISQALTVLVPVQTVGVMGDERSYENIIAVRAVETVDFMTADFSQIPYEVLGIISNRIINEVRGVNRVVYDISSKPPATIEWE
ncbi:MAG: glutamine-hydrolyzing GMP synthase [Planctomycetes bacterium]|nr:glutamine-hydrolyzing GMP synthase [Planctomycetota bacterium]MBL7146780.1 glutamine-hydrolyzing GMP synthase [Phycisphaerae bacterium]